MSLPQAQVNADWTDRNGGPSHQINHPALGATLTPLFAVSIGEGDSRRARITSEPVVAGGVVYTFDARATVTATTVDGQPVWSRNVMPSRAQARDASGGAVMVGKPTPRG